MNRIFLYLMPELDFPPYQSYHSTVQNQDYSSPRLSTHRFTFLVPHRMQLYQKQILSPTKSNSCTMSSSTQSPQQRPRVSVLFSSSPADVEINIALCPNRDCFSSLLFIEQRSRMFWVCQIAGQQKTRNQNLLNLE